MANKTILVLGGGIGGTVVARRLRKLTDPAERIVVVDKESSFCFPPSLLWIMAGTRKPHRVTRDMANFRRLGIEFLQEPVVEIDTKEQKVTTKTQVIGYDRMVVSLGTRLAPEKLEGFEKAAHNIYSVKGALDARDQLMSFRQKSGGKVVILVSSLPYKCPAAPYEAALLSKWVLDRHGITDVAVELYTPEPFPMPVAGKEVGAQVSTLLEENGIKAYFAHQVDSIDPDNRQLTFFPSGGETDTGGTRLVPYDILLGIPPHTPPHGLKGSGLSPDDGFIPVDPETLQTSADNVFAIGDATKLPIADGKMLPKAGVFAEAEGKVVAAEIAAGLKGKPFNARFDGNGQCFLETGKGMAGFASGNFTDSSGPKVSLKQPSTRWHLLKVAFERWWLWRWAP
ncbi:MAG: NAD(P)/FAD-dependent oxidoreductase [Actinobacteria bacterium]|nr:NAD(P)/FAD-dependent oxidoreductase [Actinomycetota bacterium]MCL6104433.1 NAD(P)/FAD-dependent oxidoreductase [Actinomycetota bacterium]